MCTRRHAHAVGSNPMHEAEHAVGGQCTVLSVLTPVPHCRTAAGTTSPRQAPGSPHSGPTPSVSHTRLTSPCRIAVQRPSPLPHYRTTVVHPAPLQVRLRHAKHHEAHAVVVPGGLHQPDPGRGHRVRRLPCHALLRRTRGKRCAWVRRHAPGHVYVHAFVCRRGVCSGAGGHGARGSVATCQRPCSGTCS